MSKFEIKADTRDVIGKKVEKIREQGKVPAVVYGAERESENISVDQLQFSKIFAEAGESTIMELDIAGKKVPVLVYDFQKNPLTGDYSHIDFYEIVKGKEIETEVALEFVGESEAVKSLGGVLVTSVEEIEVVCLPKDLPSKIEVDISVLKTFEDHIKVSDLNIPEGVKIDLEGEMVVASVTPPRSEEELASLDEKVEEDVSKVEGVEKKEEEENTEDEKKEEKKEEKEEK